MEFGENSNQSAVSVSSFSSDKEDVVINLLKFFDVAQLGKSWSLGRRSGDDVRWRKKKKTSKTAAELSRRNVGKAFEGRFGNENQRLLWKEGRQ